MVSARIEELERVCVCVRGVVCVCVCWGEEPVIRTGSKQLKT